MLDVGLRLLVFVGLIIAHVTGFAVVIFAFAWLGKGIGHVADLMVFGAPVAMWAVLAMLAGGLLLGAWYLWRWAGEIVRP